MLLRRLKLVGFWPITLALLCLHVASMLIFQSQIIRASYCFMLIAPLLALSVCCAYGFTSARQTRRLWLLLAVALLLWEYGLGLSAWEESIPGVSLNVAFTSDFAFYIYGLPILLAISAPLGEQRTRLFYWLDGAQASFAAFLIYLTLFGVVPFSKLAIHPIPIHRLAQTYNVENLLLAAFATVRLAAIPKSAQERSFFRSLSIFLWAYALCAAFYNHITVTVQGAHTLYDAVVDIPFLLFATASLWRNIPAHADQEMQVKSTLSLFIDNSSALFYTFALLVLGLTNMRVHPLIGVATITAAGGIYGARTVFLQTRYMQSQAALQEARDKLEEMSLKDGLTNVANRRCFDRTLQTEWDRAIRTRRPMALIFIDIDHFKALNDKYGHPYGDECLIRMAEVVHASLPRRGDLLARYGGEEFAVILPETDSAGARLVADRVQESVRALSVLSDEALACSLTVSIGIAIQNYEHMPAPAALIQASDRALYKAKENGRNRVEVFSEAEVKSCATCLPGNAQPRDGLDI